MTASRVPPTTAASPRPFAAIIEERSFDLIESMAAAIADEILALERVDRVTAVVHKPNAAGRLGIDGVAAAATAPHR